MVLEMLSLRCLIGTQMGMLGRQERGWSWTFVLNIISIQTVFKAMRQDEVYK